MATIPTLLLVDDNGAVLEIETQLLRNLGFNVIAKNDSVEALAMVVEGREDLAALVCDFEMPTVNGEQLARAAKKQRPIPVLILSGTLPPDPQPASWDAPWDAWFVKGTQLNEFLRYLRTIKDAYGGNYEYHNESHQAPTIGPCLFRMLRVV